MGTHVIEENLDNSDFDIDQNGVVTIKSGGVVNYSTTEHTLPQTWIGGETIYRKVVNFGSLPNATTKNVAHGITNLDVVISLEGVARNTIIGNYLPLSYPTGTARVELLIQGSDIRIVTDSNFQDWTQTYIIIEYTKTT